MLYSSLSFCFHHSLLNISIIINTCTSAPKLYSFTRRKKVQIWDVLKRPLYHFRFWYTTKIRGSTGILHCKIFYSTPDDYVKNWCKVSRILPNGKMDVSISHFESPNDVIFRCCEILWVRADDVYMSYKWVLTDFLIIDRFSK